MKSGHDIEMSALHQSNRENKTACDTEMVKMKAMNQREMSQRTADHSVAMLVMRQKNHDVKVKRNEHVNVVKLANAQRVANLGQRLDAQCSDFKKKTRERSGALSAHENDELQQYRFGEQRAQSQRR